MPTNATTTAAVTAGIPVVGEIAGAISQGVQNRAQRKWNEKMYAIQRRDALADMAMQNAYNSPAAEMQRLAAAGLNPNLVYKNGGATNEAAPVRSSNVPAWNPHPASFNGAAVSAAYFDASVKQAQVDNLKAQTTLAGIEGLLKTAQTIGTEAGTAETRTRTGKIALESEHSVFDLKLKNELHETSLESARALLNKTLAETQRTETESYTALNEDERRTALNAVNIQKAAEEILTLRLNRSTVPLQKQKLQEEIDLLKKDNRIKELDAKLSEMHIRPGDPVYWRALNEIMEGVNKKVIPRVQEILRKTVPKDAVPIMKGASDLFEKLKPGFH